MNVSLHKPEIVDENDSRINATQLDEPQPE